MGEVHLKVSDLSEALVFYRDILGYSSIELDPGVVALSAGAGNVNFVLHELPNATPLKRRTTGLFHAAILLPVRRNLAQVVQQLTAHGWDIGGASDHGVSEALYLNDPDNNGIEIYVDRPRDQWPVQGSQVRMVTERLDFDNLFAELDSTEPTWSGIPPGTRIGHVHLQVSDLDAARHFYTTVLGFDIMQETYPGALFVAAGGYHHHIGMNVWAGKGVPQPLESSVGLQRFVIELPDTGSLQALSARVQQSGFGVREATGSAIYVRDPDGIEIEFRARA